MYHVHGNYSIIIISGWSSACRVPDETESWSILWRATCCQTNSLKFQHQPTSHLVSSPRSVEPVSLPFSVMGRWYRSLRALCRCLFPCSEGAELQRALLCPTSIIEKAAVLMVEKSSSNHSKLLVGHLKSCYLGIVRNGVPRQIGLSSHRHCGEFAHFCGVLDKYTVHFHLK